MIAEAYKAAATVLKVVLRLVPIDPRIAITTIAISPAISAYSIAVTPDLPLKRFAKSARKPHSPKLKDAIAQIGVKHLINCKHLEAVRTRARAYSTPANRSIKLASLFLTLPTRG